MNRHQFDHHSYGNYGGGRGGGYGGFTNGYHGYYHSYGNYGYHPHHHPPHYGHHRGGHNNFAFAQMNGNWGAGPQGKFWNVLFCSDFSKRNSIFYCFLGWETGTYHPGNSRGRGRGGRGGHGGGSGGQRGQQQQQGGAQNGRPAAGSNPSAQY